MTVWLEPTGQLARLRWLQTTLKPFCNTRMFELGPLQEAHETTEGRLHNNQKGRQEVEAFRSNQQSTNQQQRCQAINGQN